MQTKQLRVLTVRCARHSYITFGEALGVARFEPHAKPSYGLFKQGSLPMQ